MLFFGVCLVVLVSVNMVIGIVGELHYFFVFRRREVVFIKVIQDFQNVRMICLHVTTITQLVITITCFIFTVNPFFIFPYVILMSSLLVMHCKTTTMSICIGF